jgi:hypothetical protein
MVLSSCVDDLPIPSSPEERKLFVICEMKVGDSIIADVTYTGNTRGQQSEPITDGKSLQLSLAEGDKDFGVPFEFSDETKYYYILPEKLSLKQGVRYKFRGIGTNSNFVEPIITIPAPMVLENVQTEIIDSIFLDGKFTTKVKCTVKLPITTNKESYFFITPTSEDGNKCKASFIKDYQAFKALSNKSGFLIDYKRITNNELEFFIEISELKKTRSINMEFGNVTESFYKFNHYFSNVVAGIGNETSNPAIAGFNITTDKSFGTFSANTSFKRNFVIR